MEISIASRPDQDSWWQQQLSRPPFPYKRAKLRHAFFTSSFPGLPIHAFVSAGVRHRPRNSAECGAPRTLNVITSADARCELYSLGNLIQSETCMQVMERNCSCSLYLEEMVTIEITCCYALNFIISIVDEGVCFRRTRWLDLVTLISDGYEKDRCILHLQGSSVVHV